MPQPVLPWRLRGLRVPPPHVSSVSTVPSDLTAEERQELENIRRRKQELLADIQVGGRVSRGRGEGGPSQGCPSQRLTAALATVPSRACVDAHLCPQVRGRPSE